MMEAKIVIENDETFLVVDTDKRQFKIRITESMAYPQFTDGFPSLVLQATNFEDYFHRDSEDQVVLY